MVQSVGSLNLTVFFAVCAVHLSCINRFLMPKVAPVNDHFVHKGVSAKKFQGFRRFMDDISYLLGTNR